MLHMWRIIGHETRDGGLVVGTMYYGWAVTSSRMMRRKLTISSALASGQRPDTRTSEPATRLTCENESQLDSVKAGLHARKVGIQWLPADISACELGKPFLTVD